EPRARASPGTARRPRRRRVARRSRASRSGAAASDARSRAIDGTAERGARSLAGVARLADPRGRLGGERLPVRGGHPTRARRDAAPALPELEIAADERAQPRHAPARRADQSGPDQASYAPAQGAVPEPAR